MTVTVALPFYSAGQPIAVTQVPGDGSHSGYLYNSWDFALETDWRVRAIARGKVIDIRETVPDGDSYQLTTDSSYGSGGIGNIVTLKHRVAGEVFYSSYFHLQNNSVIVAIGDRVLAGQEIGQVGLTGARTGAHLHMQVGTSSLAFGSTDNYGWPVDSDNHKPQIIANASNTTANVGLINFRGYTSYGYDLPDHVVGPPPLNATATMAAIKPVLTFRSDHGTHNVVADCFVFESHAGQNKIVDFGTDVDNLVMSHGALGGSDHTAAQAVSQFATVQGDDPLRDIGAEGTSLLQGFSTASLLIDDLLVNT